jgi:hypothetical protein
MAALSRHVISTKHPARPEAPMIANMTGSIDREVTPYQQRPKASAHCCLSLAAAPTFAVMALVTGVLGGGRPDLLCSAAEQTSPLSGMIPMYVLMSAFHSQPWLKLFANRRKRRPSGVIRPRSTCPADPARVGR